MKKRKHLLLKYNIENLTLEVYYDKENIKKLEKDLDLKETILKAFEKELKELEENDEI